MKSVAVQSVAVQSAAVHSAAVKSAAVKSAAVKSIAVRSVAVRDFQLGVRSRGQTLSCDTHHQPRRARLEGATPAAPAASSSLI